MTDLLLPPLRIIFFTFCGNKVDVLRFLKKTPQTPLRKRQGEISTFLVTKSARESNNAHVTWQRKKENRYSFTGITLHHR